MVSEFREKIKKGGRFILKTSAFDNENVQRKMNLSLFLKDV